MVGRIERVPLREVWKKEAKDFTSWLYENLEVLGEELDRADQEAMVRKALEKLPKEAVRPT